MPRKYKRRRRRRTKKRNYKIMRSPMSSKFVTTLKYQDNISLIPSVADTAAFHVFSASSLYDPNITGAGHQPRGYDQIMTMYDHYVVIGSRCKIQFCSDATSSVDNIVALALRDSSTVSGVMNNYLEGGYVVNTIADARMTSGKTLTLGYSPKKFLGRSHPLSDSQLKGAIASSPLENAFFHIITSNLPPSYIGGAISFNVSLEYIVAFIEPKVPPQS